MQSAENISLFIAFSAGLLSFVSPCVLPVIPSYISYITGLSLEELTDSEGKARAREVAIKNSLMFIGGFSFIFILLGASATLIGRFFLMYQSAIRQIGGLLIVFFGLYIMGLIKPSLLMRDARFHFQSKPAGYLGSFLVGMAFGAGWTPCVGPILGSILLYASASGSVATGITLLTAYSLGLGFPLFLSSLGVQSFLVYFKKTARYMRWISATSGVFLVVVGLLIFTNSLTRLTSFFTQIGIGWSIGQ
ncbi:MAG: cytochrome c biogenesis protein CcdA [Candidatus Manganitrophaceae bacterium]|nr:MAG: cytochrome c biogenesis protein CcdA [Candidatus Manganitrophaceae bacterium]